MIYLKNYKKLLAALLVCCTLVPSSSSAYFWQSWSKKQKTAALITTATLGLTALGYLYYSYSKYYEQIVKDKALYNACINDENSTAQFFINNGANVNTKSPEGTTPLHLACANNNYPLAEILIQNGANVNAFNNNYKSPFDVAHKENIQLIEVLIKHGAFFNQSDIDLISYDVKKIRRNEVKQYLQNIHDAEIKFETTHYIDQKKIHDDLIYRFIALGQNIQYVRSHYAKAPSDIQKKYREHAALHKPTFTS